MKYPVFISKIISVLTAVLSVCSLYGQDAQYYFYQGEKYLAAGNIDSAIYSYSQAIRLDPGNWYYYQLRAMYYERKKQYDLAIPDWTKAISLNPKFPDFYGARARVYDLINNQDLAIQDITNVIKLDTARYTNRYSQRAFYFINSGKYKEAVEDYKNILKNPRSLKSNYLIIISPLIRLQRFAEAASYYDQYKKSNRAPYYDSDKFKFYTTYFPVAVTQTANGNLEDALASLDIATEQFDTGEKEKEEMKTWYIDILFLKGYILEKLDRLEEAKIICEQSLALNAKQPDQTDALQRMSQKRQVLSGTDKTPPEIILKRPVPAREFDIVSDNLKTIVTARAKDLSGIASLTINNQPVKADENGFFDTDFELQAGANSIIIKATDKKGNTATKTFVINGVAAKTEIAAPAQEVKLASGESPNFYAIFIAASKYEDGNITDLENPVRDTRTLKTILETDYSFDPKNIDTFYNRSKLDILIAISIRSNSLTENDNPLIFFAGHGTAVTNNDKTIDGFLIPSDAKKGLNLTYIANSYIRNLVKNCHAKHVLIITDACFSGALTRSLGTDAATAIKLQYESMSRKVMSSGNMTAVPDKSKFIEYLIKRLKQNTDKYLSVKKPFDSFYENVMNETDPLTAPLLRLLPGLPDDGGKFIF